MEKYWLLRDALKDFFNLFKDVKYSEDLEKVFDFLKNHDVFPYGKKV